MDRALGDGDGCGREAGEDITQKAMWITKGTNAHEKGDDLVAREGEKLRRPRLVVRKTPQGRLSYDPIVDGRAELAGITAVAAPPREAELGRR